MTQSHPGASGVVPITTGAIRVPVSRSKVLNQHCSISSAPGNPRLPRGEKRRRGEGVPPSHRFLVKVGSEGRSNQGCMLCYVFTLGSKSNEVLPLIAYLTLTLAAGKRAQQKRERADGATSSWGCGGEEGGNEALRTIATLGFDSP